MTIASLEEAGDLEEYTDGDTDVEVLDQLEELGELEDLEDLAYDDDQSSPLLPISDEPHAVAELEDLGEVHEPAAASELGYIRTSMMNLFESILSRQTTSGEVVVERDGMLTISDQVYRSSGSPGESKLASMLAEDREPEAIPDESDLSGIHDFFEGGDIDLDDILGDGDDHSEGLSGDQRQFYQVEGQGSGVKLSESGALYEEYEQSFSRRPSGKLKAMMQFSRDLNAITVALVTSVDGTLNLENAIGYPREDFDADNDFDKRLLNDIMQDQIVEYFPPAQLANRLPSFAAITDRVNGMLVLPAKYEGRTAALIIGLHDAVGDLASFCAEHFEI
jgi:hypothetical protein